MNWTPEAVAEALPKLTPDERRELAALMDAPEPLAYREFVEKVNPRYNWHAWCEVLGGELQAVADGHTDRLMVWAPPRHGKTEQTSRLFPAYYLYRYPERHVGLCSYGAQVAHDMSRSAREYFREAGAKVDDAPLLDRDASAVTVWKTKAGGEMWATGRGGPVTGRGGHLLIVDDPIKDEKEAESERVRRNLQEWYGSTFYTRLEPGGAIVIIQTRWNEDDLCGHLLSLESSDDHIPEGWRIVDLPAFAGEQAEYEYPDTCTVVEDFRAPGAPLCPERFPTERLHQIRSNTAGHWWAALYEQRPQPREGGMFKREWFRIVDSLPGGDYFWCRYWDKAGTEDGGAYTAGVLMGKSDNTVAVADVTRFQHAAGKREERISALMETDSEVYGDVVFGVEQEPGSGGKESAETTVTRNPGYVVRRDRVTGAKEIRAEPLAIWAELHGLYLLAGDWNEGFIDRMCAFPHGRYKDDVDAASGAFSQLAKMKKPRKMAAPKGRSRASPYRV